MDLFKIGKGVHQGCILLRCLFNLYAEHIMWNAGLDEAQAGIKTAGKNNNFNMQMITLMTKSEEELKSPLMTEKGERESWLRTQHSKTKIMASGPITSWQIDGGKSGNSGTFYFPGLLNHYGWWLQPWNEKMLAPWKKSYDKPRQHIKKQRHYFANKAIQSKLWFF